MGKIEAGYVQVGDRLLAMPPNETCTVKGIVCREASLHFKIHFSSIIVLLLSEISKLILGYSQGWTTVADRIDISKEKAWPSIFIGL